MATASIDVDRMLYLTELTGMRVFAPNGQVVGRVRDVAITPSEHPRRVSRFLVGRRIRFLARYDQVASISLDGIRLSDDRFVPFYPDDSHLLLCEDLLDQQIVDVNGRKVVRVNDLALRVDVTGTFLCSLAAVPHMRRAGGGRIVNFSDWVAASGRRRYPGFLPYYVAKSAVIGLTEALALELAPDSILVNAIAPGPIRPPAEMGKDEIDKVSQTTPIGRWGGDREIVKAVVSLIESDFVTGETIRVDGGRHLR